MGRKSTRQETDDIEKAPWNRGCDFFLTTQPYIKRWETAAVSVGVSPGGLARASVEVSRINEPGMKATSLSEPVRYTGVCA